MTSARKKLLEVADELDQFHYRPSFFLLSVKAICSGTDDEEPWIIPNDNARAGILLAREQIENDLESLKNNLEEARKGIS